MIIVNLNGGLGNQMFQYSAARSLSYRLKVPLKLDLTEFRKFPLRVYRLKHFNIHAEPATEKEIAQFRGTGAPTFLIKVKNLPDFFKPYYKRKLFREQCFAFDPNIQQCQENIYLDGYWQSEKYFKDIEQIIRKDFTFSKKPDTLNEQMAERIRDCEAVSIHVRRGDYLSNPVTTAYHGICSEEYYRSAIGTVEKYINNPYFFIFSDDPTWVKENLKTGYPSTIIDFNGSEKDYEDLRLMSLCKHYIIANSSFSWWGAWLSNNPQKIVIAPKKWFNNTDINTDDLIPEKWKRI